MKALAVYLACSLCAALGYATHAILSAGKDESERACHMTADAYDIVAGEHVISTQRLHELLDEWDEHPGRMAMPDRQAGKPMNERDSAEVVAG